MLRKLVPILLALLVGAVVFLAIDCERRAEAAGRLESHSGVHLDGWSYRIVHVPTTSPAASKGRLVRWLWRRAASPRTASVGGVVGIDEQMLRDLEILHLQSLQIYDCRELTPQGIARLTAIPSLHSFSTVSCHLTEAELNRIWSNLPELTDASVSAEPHIGQNGFRDVGRARKLKRLTLYGVTIDNWTIARLRDAPALEELNVGITSVTEESAAVLASMPALREIQFIFPDDPATARLITKLKALNPKLKVTTLTIKTVS